MRKFIVLGFRSNSKDEPGEGIYFGTDRGEAIEAVNTPVGEDCVRQELYELAVPHIRRHFAESVKPADDENPPDPDDENPPDPLPGKK